MPMDAPSGVPPLVHLVAELLAQLEGTAVTECEFRSGEHRILLRRSPSFSRAAMRPQDPDEETIPPHWSPVLSPLTGIYYSAENPQSPPLVTIGGTIEVGQTIGLVEAMKTFNRVESDRAGVVRSIAVADGAEVQMGQPLLYIEPEGAAS